MVCIIRRFTNNGCERTEPDFGHIHREFIANSSRIHREFIVATLNQCLARRYCGGSLYGRGREAKRADDLMASKPVLKGGA
jgi:hypothetical protein